MANPNESMAATLSSRSPLENCRVLVSGGSSGIGQAVARRVVNAGGRVVLLGRSRAKLDAAQNEFGTRAETVSVDVTDEAAVARILGALGPIDHIVTAAAGTARGTVVELDTAAARGLFESKYWGQYYCVKYGAPLLPATGSITLFSGWISRKPMVGTSTLAAIDAAIEALTRVLTLELAPVRVNAVVPGMIDTPIWRARLSEEEQRAFFAATARSLPVGRSGRADDIAHAVQFLMENGFTTGAVLDVDGGQR